MEIILIAIVGLIIIVLLSTQFLKKFRKPVSAMEIVMGCLYVLSLFPFALGLLFHSNDYQTAIDPVDSCYIPFGGKHIMTLIFYFITLNIALFALWNKGRRLPPLTLVLAILFLIIGLMVNVFVFIQILGHQTASIDLYKNNDGTGFFIFTPIIILIIGTYVLLCVINEEHTEAKNRVFKNSFLNTCNQFLAKKFDAPIWAIILLFPVLIGVTLILILFGQDINSLIKVFTDTTTWTFSQKMHPPTLEHQGHYLCTVAAKGDPKIVKPIHLGTRYGHTIIVNRQLQIANAFEELIYKSTPKLHHFIRKNYDRYGYNLSRKINTRMRSTVTYILMKPLEWVFLLIIYLFCQQPEELIKKQYRYK
ncbi:hypothetical protein LZQ00_04525 [Sphingobacterium sp. SRCM116780]|uniref:DUF6688 domain-containing protein n=1 Tax=Sphingobacterium sp. SRCM116780 TaxID=2907623 RepID=UPI001F461887|nr:DUF6688 family protein [Sphingobacterium sp. SRCM116780]UIR57082.1 hypothetical protein LZQ00_04525 [Sphingobacterium sp. SRCM116780]